MPIAVRTPPAVIDRTKGVEEIRSFVETNEWQLGEIRKALEEADAGEFAGDEELRAVSWKWKVNARQAVAHGTAQPRRGSQPHRRRRA